MLIPVNLYVDRMSPVQPVRIADVYAITQERKTAYAKAAAMMNLTPAQYDEFENDLTTDKATYGPLPRQIDAMAGIHKRNGHVYVLKHVLVPQGSMGWEIDLSDGTAILIPRICGNLSMNRAHNVAKAIAPKKRIVQKTAMTQIKYVRAARYIAPAPASVALTPVSFDVPAAPIVTAGAVTPIAAGAVAAHASALPFLGLLAPVIASFGGGGSHFTAPPTSVVPPCASGSNEIGVCHL